MPARSAVEKLPQEVRKTLETWLGDFHAGRLSLDEIMSRLQAQMVMSGLDPAEGPSRSSVHRHGEKFAKVAERVKRSEAFADALAREVGPQVADGKGLQVLIQAFQSLAFDMIGNLEDDQVLDPENLMFFSRSIQAVAGAQKTDADRSMKIAQEARKTAATKAEVAAKSRGVSADTIAFIKEAVLGV